MIYIVFYILILIEINHFSLLLILIFIEINVLISKFIKYYYYFN